MTDTPVVLFLCTHNAGRSLAAKILLDHYAQGAVDIRSAGSEPARELNPSVVAVLLERGLDPTRVVSMGCGDSCPVMPGTRHLEWDLEDPAGKPVASVRPIVDEIDRRVRALLAELTAG